MKKAIPFRDAKRAAKMTDAEVARALRASVGNVRGISVHSISLWSRGIRPPPWWLETHLRVILGTDVIVERVRAVRRARA